MFISKYLDLTGARIEYWDSYTNKLWMINCPLKDAGPELGCTRSVLNTNVQTFQNDYSQSNHFFCWFSTSCIGGFIIKM